jgi:small ligand-binding sensory domain FIST
VSLVTRVTQGCQPITRQMRVTAAEGNVILSLDQEPALDRLLQDLSISLERPQEAMATLRSTLVGLSLPGGAAVGRTGSFGDEVRVRHIIGLDPGRRGVAVAEQVEAGMPMAFCQRNGRAARADLVRICAEIREALEPEEMSAPLAASLALPAALSAPHPQRRIAGAVYVSCTGRGGPHFGAPSAELQVIRHALGEVPLVGFFAAGEIAGQQLYGYTGVLTVFTTPAYGG